MFHEKKNLFFWTKNQLWLTITLWDSFKTGCYTRMPNPQDTWIWHAGSKFPFVRLLIHSTLLRNVWSKYDKLDYMEDSKYPVFLALVELRTHHIGSFVLFYPEQNKSFSNHRKFEVRTACFLWHGRLNSTCPMWFVNTSIICFEHLAPEYTHRVRKNPEFWQFPKYP